MEYLFSFQRFTFLYYAIEESENTTFLSMLQTAQEILRADVLESSNCCIKALFLFWKHIFFILDIYYYITISFRYTYVYLL